MIKDLKIAMSELEITPPAPVSLQGQFYTRVSTHVESPLYASVFVADSGEDALIICSLDLASVPLAYCNSVRELIRQRCPDLPVDKLIFNTTHTHTGPVFCDRPKTLHVAARFLPEGSTFSLTGEKLPDDVWLADRCGPYIAKKIAEAVCNAWTGRQPGRISPAFGRAVVGHCRRVVYDDDSAHMYGSVETINFRELEGGNDSGIELLYVFDATGQPLGVLANVSCPSQVLEHEHYISSDYWGKVRDQVKARLGEDFVVLGLCGAAGDQSPRDLVRRSAKKARRTDVSMHSLEGATELGGRIASVILDKLAVAEAAAVSTAQVRHEVLQLEFPLRRVTKTEVAQAKAAVDAYVAKNKKTVYGLEDIQALHIHGGILERSIMQENMQFVQTEIHVARLGDIAFASNPFELFLDYGNQIKALSDAAQTFIIQLASDSLGYLPTRKGERGSHYSAYVSSGRTGHQGGELLVRKTVQAINRLWQEEEKED